MSDDKNNRPPPRYITYEIDQRVHVCTLYGVLPSGKRQKIANFKTMKEASEFWAHMSMKDCIVMLESVRDYLRDIYQGRLLTVKNQWHNWDNELKLSYLDNMREAGETMEKNLTQKLNEIYGIEEPETKGETA